MKSLFTLLVSSIIFFTINFPLNAQNVFNTPKIEKNGSVKLTNEQELINFNDLVNSNQNNSQAWKDFCQKNGNWSASFNKLTNTPHSAIGNAIKIEGFSKITPKNIEEAALKFIRDNAKVLNVNPDYLKLKKKVFANKRWYVSFVQMFNGYEVLLSEVNLRIFNNGNVMAFGSDYYNDISMPNNKLLSNEDIFKSAVLGVEYNLKKNTPLASKELYILPIIGQNIITYRLVYEIRFSSNNPLGKYISFVDANDGTLHWRINTINNLETPVKVSGLIRPRTPLDSLVDKPFPNLFVNIDGNDYLTDSEGKVNVNIQDTALINISMRGPRANVYWIDHGAHPNYITTGKAGIPLNIDLKDSICDFYSRMLFYQANIQYDYLKMLDSGFAANVMNFPIHIGIAWGDSAYNAYANSESEGNTIIFTGVKDINYRLPECPSVLYHEYGHSINQYLYNYVNQDSLGMVNGGCNEATADVFSAFLLDDSRLGLGAMISDSLDGIRNINNNYIYPDSATGESHEDGKILSGAFWDLRKLIGIDEARKLAHYCKYGTPDNINFGIACTDWLVETLIADDDDGNLANGTPHIKEIVTAFNKHRIGTNLLNSLAIYHNPLTDTQDTINSYPVNFGFAVSSDLLLYKLDSVSVLWSSDNFKTFNSADAVIKGNNQYIAYIPAQKAGTQVSYYFSATDIISEQRFDIKSYQHTVPFTFLVGYNTIYSNDFETDPGWSTRNPKTDGENRYGWEWGKPLLGTNLLALFETGQIDISQTDVCHSGENCYVTGKDSGLCYPTDKQTLTSPTFDISTCLNPIIRFYRWFYAFKFGNADSYIWTELSDDDGLTWVSCCDTVKHPTRIWEKVDICVKNYIKQTKYFKARIVLNNQASVTGMVAFYNMAEGLIDDFSILSGISQATNVNDDNISENMTVKVYPNPSSDAVSFQYFQNNGNPVNISLFDLLGNELMIFTNIIQSTPTLSINWDRKGHDGSIVKPGIYIYRILQDNYCYMGKLILY